MHRPLTVLKLKFPTNVKHCFVHSVNILEQLSSFDYTLKRPELSNWVFFNLSSRKEESGTQNTPNITSMFVGTVPRNVLIKKQTRIGKAVFVPALHIKLSG